MRDHWSAGALAAIALWRNAQLRPCSGHESFQTIRGSTMVVFSLPNIFLALALPVLYTGCRREVDLSLAVPRWGRYRMPWTSRTRCAVPDCSASDPRLFVEICEGEWKVSVVEESWVDA